MILRKLASGVGADVACAAGLALLALALYAATLQPDLGGPEDTPKFQFLGYVLGTAHPPGYPLYSLISHAFVTLVPFGSIAYRANLLSAVAAALACGLTFLIARGIGARRLAAAIATLGLASGVHFWRSAVFAEVYGIAAANTALIVLFLLAWRRSQGTWLLLAAVAAVSLAAGNHLIVLGLVPAAVIFVLLVDHRVLTVRFLLAGAALVALGLAQYGFIILRTRQGALYLESRAWSLSDLYAVVTAERYATSRFAFTWHDLLFRQLPAVARTIGEDLGVVGAILLVVGLLAAIRSRRSGAWLVVGAAIGLLVFIINLEGDVGGFVTPLLVLVWPVSALGLETIGRALDSTRLRIALEQWSQPPVQRAVEAGVTSIVLLAVLATVVVRARSSFAVSNQSQNVADARFYRTLYAALPARAAVVAENYTVDMALQYLMFTGEAGPDKGVRRLAFSAREVREAIAENRRVFALSDAATFFAAEGLRFEHTSIGTALDTWLAALPAGSLILGASANAVFPAEVLGRLHVTAPSSGRGRPYTVFALVAGRAELAWKVDDRPISVLVDQGFLNVPMPHLASAPVVAADVDGARITFGQRRLASLTTGVVLAAFDAAGMLMGSFRYAPGDPLTVPLEPRVFEFRGVAPCTKLEPNVWTDISAISTVSGSWVTTLTELGTVRIETEVERANGLSVSELMGGGTARVTGTVPTSLTTRTVTSELTRTRIRRAVFRTVLDAGPGHARALLNASSRPVSICAHVPATLGLAAGGSVTAGLDIAANTYFGRGWSAPERVEGLMVRRGGSPSTILVPLAADASYRIRLDAVAGAGLWFTIEVNGTPVAECEFDGRHSCVVDVSADRLNPTVNVLTVRLSRPSADEPGVAVTLRGLDIEPR